MLSLLRRSFALFVAICMVETGMQRAHAAIASERWICSPLFSQVQMSFNQDAIPASALQEIQPFVAAQKIETGVLCAGLMTNTDAERELRTVIQALQNGNNTLDDLGIRELQKRAEELLGIEGPEEENPFFEPLIQRCIEFCENFEGETLTVAQLRRALRSLLPEHQKEFLDRHPSVFFEGEFFERTQDRLDLTEMVNTLHETIVDAIITAFVTNFAEGSADAIDAANEARQEILRLHKKINLQQLPWINQDESEKTGDSFAEWIPWGTENFVPQPSMAIFIGTPKNESRILGSIVYVANDQLIVSAVNQELWTVTKANKRAHGRSQIVYTIQNPKKPALKLSPTERVLILNQMGLSHWEKFDSSERPEVKSPILVPGSGLGTIQGYTNRDTNRAQIIIQWLSSGRTNPVYFYVLGECFIVRSTQGPPPSNANFETNVIRHLHWLKNELNKLQNPSDENAKRLLALMRQLLGIPNFVADLPDIQQTYQQTKMAALQARTNVTTKSPVLSPIIASPLPSTLEIHEHGQRELRVQTHPLETAEMKEDEQTELTDQTFPEDVIAPTNGLPETTEVQEHA